MKIKNTLALTILCIITSHAYTMEYSTTLAIFSEKPHYESQSPTYDKLHLSDDVLDKIIAYCSHKTRGYLRETCKRFYILTSINRLNKLVIHNFNIGEEKEKLAFFKAFIKTNKPHLIPTILDHAQREAIQKSYNDKHIMLELSDVTQKQKDYVQTSYKTPLLEEALKQDNDTIINILTQDEPDNAIVKEYHKQQLHKKCNIGLSLCGGVGILGVLATIITFFTWAAIDSSRCYNHSIHCSEK